MLLRIETRMIIQVLMFLPLFLSLAGGVVFFTSRIRQYAGYVSEVFTLITSLFLFIASLYLLSVGANELPMKFKVLHVIDIYVDHLSIFFILLVNLVTLVASWNGVSYLQFVDPIDKWQEPIAFHILVNFFHATMLWVSLIDNLIGVWIAVELTTLGSAFLIAYPRQPSSWEATWKYLIITSTGIVSALLGTVFLAQAVPHGNMNWSFIIQENLVGQLDPISVKTAFLFAVLGYGTKAGLAPMHTWLPDGHGEAPHPISALLSGVLLKSAVYVILRFYTITSAVVGTQWASNILIMAGTLSLLMAAPLILKNNPFKRVLAYHSLEHMGIILLGLGMGTPIAMFGALLHMLNHAIVKALMFIGFGNVVNQYKQHGIEQSKITGVWHNMPITAGILVLGGLALVGMPPFNIFLSEFLILWGTFYKPTRLSINKSIAIVILISSIILVFYGLIQHLGQLMLGTTQDGLSMRDIGWNETGPLILLFLLMLTLGIWIAPPLADLLKESVSIISTS